MDHDPRTMTTVDLSASDVDVVAVSLSLCPGCGELVGTADIEVRDRILFDAMQIVEKRMSLVIHQCTLPRLP